MSHLAFVFLHIDCPSITEEVKTPPRTVNEGVEGGIKATCPGCHAGWIIRFENLGITSGIDLTTADALPVN